MAFSVYFGIEVVLERELKLEINKLSASLALYQNARCVVY